MFLLRLWRGRKWILMNWKLIIHLLFRTRRFGVNNEWWSYFDSKIFGVHWLQICWDVIRIRPIINNYKLMKYRASMGFIDQKNYEMLFGGKK